jgi:hypothetical protein
MDAILDIFIYNGGRSTRRDVANHRGSMNATYYTQDADPSDHFPNGLLAEAKSSPVTCNFN